MPSNENEVEKGYEDEFFLLATSKKLREISRVELVGTGAFLVFLSLTATC
jgi:hypothetical protein